MDIQVRHRRFKEPPSPGQVRKESEDLLQAIAILDGVKSQLRLAANAVGELEARLANTRGELEKLDDMRRQILAGIG